MVCQNRTAVLDMFREDKRRTPKRHSSIGTESCSSIVVDVLAVESMDVARKVSIYCENGNEKQGEVYLPKQCEKDVNQQVRTTATDHEDSDWRDCNSMGRK